MNQEQNDTYFTCPTCGVVHDIRVSEACPLCALGTTLKANIKRIEGWSKPQEDDHGIGESIPAKLGV